jgi:hypothetical protein
MESSMNKKYLALTTAVCFLSGQGAARAALHAVGDVFAPEKSATTINPVLDTGYTGLPIQTFYSIDINNQNLHAYGTYVDVNKMDLHTDGHWWRTLLNEDGGYVPSFIADGDSARLTTPSHEAWSPVWTFRAPQDGQYQLDGSFYGQPNAGADTANDAQRLELFAFHNAGRPYTPVDAISVLDDANYKLTTRTFSLHEGDLIAIAGLHSDAGTGGTEFYLSGGSDPNHAGNVALTLAYYMYTPSYVAPSNPLTDPFPGGTGAASQQFFAFSGVNHRKYANYSTLTKMDTNVPGQSWFRSGLEAFPFTRYDCDSTVSSLSTSPINPYKAAWAFYAPRAGRYKIEGRVWVVNTTAGAATSQTVEAFTFTGTGHTYTNIITSRDLSHTSYGLAIPTRYLDLDVGDMIVVSSTGGRSASVSEVGGGKVYLNGGPAGQEGDLRVTYLGDDDGASARSVAQEITKEVLRPNDDPIGRPLPVLGTWDPGFFGGGWVTSWPTPGFIPDWQIDQVDAGHYLLPTFNGLSAKWTTSDSVGGIPGNTSCPISQYYEESLPKAASRGLPISFVSPNWADALLEAPYLTGQLATNPDVFSATTGSPITYTTGWGATRGYLDPMGPSEPWNEVGQSYTDVASTPLWSNIVDWYPNPPKVLHTDNNESTALWWSQNAQADANCSTSKRYFDAYGDSTTDEFKRTVVGDGWVTLYNALHRGYQQGLNTSGVYAQNSLYVGYSAIGLNHFRRWNEWDSFSLSIANRFNPAPLFWDGGGPDYYGNDSRSDYEVWSAQVEVQNIPFQIVDAKKLNPDFWFELNVWDGNTFGKVEGYLLDGQSYTPDRYKGWAQFGVWVTTPRSVREFRGRERRDSNGPNTHGYDLYGTQSWTNTGYTNEQFFLALASAVDRVHTNATLRSFWREGVLVQNTAEEHPYHQAQAAPTGYDDATISDDLGGRWFLLTASANPDRNTWVYGEINTILNVYAIAMVKGSAPNRQWLIYAHAPHPRGNDTSTVNTNLTVPGVAVPINVNVRRAGDFWLLTEGSVVPVLVVDVP